MKIVIADQDGIYAFGDQADELVKFLFDIEGALITDESWLSDFITVGLQGEAYEQEKERLWRLIEEKYGVDVRPEVCILDILRKINAPKGRA